MSWDIRWNICGRFAHPLLPQRAARYTEHMLNETPAPITATDSPARIRSRRKLYARINADRAATRARRDHAATVFATITR